MKDRTHVGRKVAVRKGRSITLQSMEIYAVYLQKYNLNRIIIFFLLLKTLNEVEIKGEYCTTPGSVLTLRNSEKKPVDCLTSQSSASGSQGDPRNCLF